jgi:hypothetical protein
LADNFFALVVPGIADQLLYNTKKTEILATLIKLRNNISVQFQDLLMLNDLKQKKTKVQFMPNPTAIEGGIFKSKKILAPPGAGKDASPNLVEPPKPVHTKTEYVPASRPAAAQNNAPRPPMGGGGPKKAPMGMGGGMPQPPRQPVAAADDWGEEEDANNGYAQPRPPMGGGPKKAPMGGMGGGPKKAPMGMGGPKKAGPGPMGGGPKKAPMGMGGPKKAMGAPAPGGNRPAPPGY